VVAEPDDEKGRKKGRKVADNRKRGILLYRAPSKGVRQKRRRGKDHLPASHPRGEGERSPPRRYYALTFPKKK